MYEENKILFYNSHYFKLYNIIQLLFMAEFPTNNNHKFLHFLQLSSEIFGGNSILIWKLRDHRSVLLQEQTYQEEIKTKKETFNYKFWKNRYVLLILPNPRWSVS